MSRRGASDWRSVAGIGMAGGRQSLAPLLVSYCFTIAVEKAVRPATIPKLCAPGEALAAHGHRMWTARVEATATRRVNEARNLATSRKIGKVLIAVWTDTTRIGCGRDQQLRIGMLRPLDYLVTWPPFNHLTSVHN